MCYRMLSSILGFSKAGSVTSRHQGKAGALWGSTFLCPLGREKQIVMGTEAVCPEESSFKKESGPELGEKVRSSIPCVPFMLGPV